MVKIIICSRSNSNKSYFRRNHVIPRSIYFYEIKGNSIEKANGGIGIIPFVYNDALKYYYALYLAKLANESKNIEMYKPKEKVIEILPPKVQPKRVRLLFEDKE